MAWKQQPVFVLKDLELLSNNKTSNVFNIINTHGASINQFLSLHTQKFYKNPLLYLQ